MNNTARIGDTRLAIVSPEGELSYKPAPEGFCTNVVCAALVGARPFTRVSYQVCTSSLYGGNEWITSATVESRPMPGWAAPGAAWCSTCGAVGFDGASPPCGCGR